MTSARAALELSRALVNDRNGPVIVFRIFLDESGTHDGSPVVTVGAYVGRPDVWAALTDDWNEAKGTVKVFHAADCQNCHGEFEGWTQQQQIELVSRLMAVLAHHDVRGLAMGLNVRDFNEAIAPRRANLSDLIGTPYEVSLQWTIDNILWLMDREGFDEQMAFVHEQNDYQAEALSVFEYLRKRWPRYSEKMTLAFASKEGFVPLQAADALAYEANKRLRDMDRPLRRSVLAMDPLGDRVTINGFSRHNMQAFLETLEKGMRAIRTSGPGGDGRP